MKVFLSIKVFVLDANVGNSVELKSLKQALKDVKGEIVDVSAASF